jgi:hypothetical protein
VTGESPCRAAVALAGEERYRERMDIGQKKEGVSE